MNTTTTADNDVVHFLPKSMCESARARGLEVTTVNGDERIVRSLDDSRALMVLGIPSGIDNPQDWDDDALVFLKFLKPSPAVPDGKGGISDGYWIRFHFEGVDLALDFMSNFQLAEVSR